MDNKKLRLWSIVIAIIVSLLLLGLYIFNPLSKDIGGGGMKVFITVFMLGFCQLFLLAIPAVRKNENLQRIIAGALLLIIMSVLYFIIL